MGPPEHGPMSTVKQRPSDITPEAAFYRTLPVDGPMEELHAHDYVTTIHVLEGVVYLISEDDERPTTPGDEAVIARGAVHRLFNAGDGEAHILEGCRPPECELHD